MTGITRLDAADTMLLGVWVEACCNLLLIRYCFTAVRDAWLTKTLVCRRTEYSRQFTG
jgi:hypothetical protein